VSLRDFPPLSPLYDAFFDALGDRLLRAAEVADHLRYSEQHLANMRRVGRSSWLPWVDLPGGSIRYRLADVARAQILGQRGPLTVERACQAIAAAPNMTAEAKAAAQAALLRAFPDL